MHVLMHVAVQRVFEVARILEEQPLQRLTRTRASYRNTQFGRGTWRVVVSSCETPLRQGNASETPGTVRRFVPTMRRASVKGSARHAQRELGEDERERRTALVGLNSRAAVKSVAASL